MGYFLGPLGQFFPEKWPPYFWKPWMSPYVAAGFFFSEKCPPDFSRVMGLFLGPLGKIFLESWASFFDP